MENNRKRKSSRVNDQYNEHKRAFDHRKKVNEDKSLWYWKMKEFTKIIPNADKPGNQKISPEDVQKLYLRAQKLLLSFKKQNKESSLEMELSRRGTSQDRIAAMTSLIMKKPLTNLETIDNILNMVSSSKNDLSELAIHTLRDLFINVLMPYRELIHMKDHNVSYVSKLVKDIEKKNHKKDYEPNEKETAADQILILWYFEQALKNRYSQFIHKLNEKMTSIKCLDHVKVSCLRVFRELICFIPELRGEVSKLLVNKLGDSQRIIRTRVMSYLLSLIDKGNFWYCPHLDRIGLVNEVLNLVNRSGNQEWSHSLDRLSSCSKFFRHFKLDTKDNELSKLLIKGYQVIMDVLIKESKTHSDHDPANPIYSECMQDLLIGLKFATAIYATEEENPFKEMIAKVLFVGRKNHFDVTIQALRLLWVLKQKYPNEYTDRNFQQLLYDTLMHRERNYSANAHLLNVLVYNQVRSEENEAFQIAFCKRLLQSCTASLPAFSIDGLITIEKILRHCPKLRKYLTETQTSEEKVEYLPAASLENVNADSTNLWEMYNFSTHFHPIAKSYSQEIIHELKPTFQGNPMDELSFMPFLRSFTMKPPKKKSEIKDPIRDEKYFSLLPPSEIKAHEEFEMKFFKRKRNQQKKFETKKDVQEKVDEYLDQQESSSDDEEAFFDADNKDISSLQADKLGLKFNVPDVVSGKLDEAAEVNENEIAALQDDLEEADKSKKKWKGNFEKKRKRNDQKFSRKKRKTH